MVYPRDPHLLTRKLVSKLRKLNIFPRLFLVFCALLFASTAFITVFNQASYSREVENNTVKYLSVLVQNANFKLQQEKEKFEQGMRAFTYNESMLSAIAQNIALQEQAEQGEPAAAERYAANRALIEKKLLSLKSRMEGIRAVLFVGEHTQYNMEMDQNKVRGAFVRDLDAFYQTELYTQTVASQGYPVWRDAVEETPQLFFERDDGRFGILGCVTLSYQVYAPESRDALGMLICCIDPQYFTKILREYSSQEGGNTFIVGENGLVEGIAAEFDAPPFPQAADTLFQTVFAQNDGNLRLQEGKRDLLVSFCGTPNFPLRIVNLTYRDYALQKADKLGWLNFGILLIVLVIGAAGFYLTAISIAYPVTRLIGAMQRVGAGDFDAVYQPESRDEIGVLCKEFDHMIADMKELINRVYVSETREKALALAEKSAQLDALQMQVNPHFLYNTLDMIRWQCMYENGGESAASDMIERFCTLLRMTIKKSEKKETIADSLLHAQTYLEVVNFRHTSKIQLETTFAFEPAAYFIPCLSLQPILENAIRHGFSGEETENRKIWIRGSYQNEKNLEICISDNGHGMTEEQTEALRASMEGQQVEKGSIGLRNVDQRLKLCYGEHYGIHIESQPDKGTRVILTIPAEMEDTDGI